MTSSKQSEKFSEVFDVLEHVEESFTLLELVHQQFKSNPASSVMFDTRVIDRINALMIWKREMFDG